MSWILLPLLIVITELVGILSGVLSGDLSQIYTMLVKPPLSPPGWVFGVVWPVLYALMATAAFIYLKSTKKNRQEGIVLYIIQLFLNFCWPLLFFRWGFLWAALFENILLAFVVYNMAVLFKKSNALAGYLLYPYFFWLLYAIYLNFATALLN